MSIIYNFTFDEKVCNSHDDCDDGADESNKSCTEGIFYVLKLF